MVRKIIHIFEFILQEVFFIETYFSLLKYYYNTLLDSLASKDGSAEKVANTK